MEPEFVDLGIDILCCRMDRLERWDMPNLSAPYWRLYWNDSPGAEIVVGERCIRLTPARFVVIPPDTRYASRLRRPVRHFYLHFTVRPAYHPLRPAAHSFPASRELVAAVEEIDGILRGDEGPALRTSVLALFLAHAAVSRVPADAFQDDYGDERVRRVVEHMRRHLADKISNPTLARMSHMNANAFIRLFRETTGLTPQAYLARLRIERACMLLHYTRKSVEEIADETGYCDRYHLSHTFKKLRGMGPAAFRRAQARTAD